MTLHISKLSSKTRQYILKSVQSWNFKDGAFLKVRSLAKNQHTTKEKKTFKE